MSSESQIWVIPFFGQGHLFPCMELSKHIASRNLKTTFIISSNLSSSIPSSFREHPLVEIAEIPSLPPSKPELDSSSGGPPPNDHPHNHHSDLVQGIERLLLENSTQLPACAIIDVMMDWTRNIFMKFKIPIIGFSTSGACSAALEYGMWKAGLADIKPGEKRLIPGLPEEMALTDSDFKHGPPPGPPPPGLAGFGFPRGRGQPRPPPPPLTGHRHGFPPGPPPGGAGTQNMGPPQPGGQPPWIEVANDSVALTDSDFKHGPPPGPPPPNLAGFGFPHGLGQPRPPPPPPPLTGHGHGHGFPPGPPPGGAGPQNMGPPQPGGQPPWIEVANDSVALTDSDFKHGPPPGPPPPNLAGFGFPRGRGQPRPPPPPLTGHGNGFPPGPPPGGDGPQNMGPPQPGGQPPWIEVANDSVALMLNSCNDLEGPFLDYLGTQIGKPVWGVGPLLPQQFWKSFDSLLHDRDIRANKQSNVTEDEVMEWLDSKPHKSVLYVSFGSEVAPTKQEFEQLADALEESKKPFIWVIQHGSGRPGPPPGPPQLVGNQPPPTPGSSDIEESYFPHGLDQKVGKRGLIIHGWAPQLLILSHPSTGGFLSHCGWNSTVEAIGRGVSILAWPIRGDQHFNAKLVVNYLKVGCMVSDSLSQEKIKKDDISKGIEKLMESQEIKRQAVMLSSKFHHGFPSSSAASLDAFKDFIVNRNAD